MQQPFIHLRVHSSYSLGQGAIKLDDLAKHCVNLQMPAVAVTDHNNLFGSLEFSIECQKKEFNQLLVVA